ncbi:four-carbon acid sugar kinase family protein [Bauldia litoralis]|uniref:Uncharacterized conserved protein YgbK, DUF1537 family n=1 Tax=Bauldia litoralis TaxID=665467 RepID=A0A1G6EB68_9HYPH|nr:four-carbon acid sugar kinase family protein [Bauldia litoralis]SDB54602.1 Uncharacterized conserved protein YgbK, DUF1537 family [Bauldia litoralis]
MSQTGPVAAPLPSGLLVAWYGDDFTGAAAVMEVLTFAGLPSILFLDVPNEAQLARFPGLRGVGIASTARSKSPEWMDANLPAAFRGLAQLQPPLLHYKVCSTLDSSPQVGSIGRAIEIASREIGFTAAPILVAAPAMRRYQCFGHLFAAVGDTVYRLDRHPVMARHPVTPMTESDVARHIAAQSERLDVSLMSLEALAAPGASLAAPTGRNPDRIDAVTLDCMDAASEAAAGRLIWEERDANPFVVGSQGVEYALVRYWQEHGLIETRGAAGSIGRADRMVAVSGSVSPTTGEQIGWSRTNGFDCIAFDAALACGDPASLAAETARVVDRAIAALERGADPLIHTAEGVDDPAVARFNQALAASQRPAAEVNQAIGEALGLALHEIVTRTGVSRAVISGGDTSGYATQQLGIYALSALAPTIPGAAIFRAHADGAMDGLELALKGGQMGSPDYFGRVRDGGGAR